MASSLRASLGKATFLLFASLAAAGEINVFTSSTCASGSSYFTFSATQTSSCLDFSNMGNFNAIQSARTALVPGCTFKAYTDKACSALSHTIVSSSGSGSCLPVGGGIKSMQVTCSPSSVLPRDTEERATKAIVARGTNDALNSGALFWQPQVTWNGLSSGAAYVFARNVSDGFSGQISSNIAFDAKNATDQLYNAAAGTHVTTLQTSGTDVSLSISSYSGYNVAGALSVIGPAAFESMIADGLQRLINDGNFIAAWNVTDFLGNVLFKIILS